MSDCNDIPFHFPLYEKIVLRINLDLQKISQIAIINLPDTSARRVVRAWLFLYDGRRKRQKTGCF
jgi:hypothetical protein